MELQDLLSKALANQTPKKTRRRADSPITAKELAEADRRMRERFTLPENWTQTRIVLLVHDETDTLLGCFNEFTHNLTTGCRRLVRCEGAAKFDAQERVSGVHWIAEQTWTKPEGSEFEAEETRPAIIDIHMPELDNVFAPGVEVDVVLHWGSIARVELTVETWFYGKDRKVQLSLPEGLDIREGLSLETRMRLKEFLGL